MNIKKMFTALSAMVVAVTMTLPSASVFGAEYSQELQDAYNWAYSKGVTTMSTIDNANMYGAITRAEMAKMLSVYSTEVLGNTPDTSKACTFTDIDSVKGDLHDFIIESCQLGIMGQGITAFRPYDTISRAEFGTALSRVLWGDKYEGGTPYYANHLNALKSAAIMNQIANAESTKEIRGYVMLMLMRSEGGSNVDCEDPAIALACLDPELDVYKDCPAACREDNNADEDGVVKSGSLAVSSEAADDKSVVVAKSSSAISDLDTLTFKTSEEVTLNKVVLEKYGFSKADNLIKNIWLEDEDGNEITTKSTPNSKGLVNLTLKRDYKVIDGTLNATIVVETNSTDDGAVVGGTIGFKVKDVDSTAKDVDLGNYKAYKYDVVAYDGAVAKVSARGGSKDYNYEAGESYEVSKFKVKAPDDSAILVKGFTLKNDGANATLDTYDYLDIDEVEVTVAGKSVKATVSINKDQELTVSFKESVEIAAKANTEFVVNAKLNSDFDEYGKAIQFTMTNISATDKNNARINIDTAGVTFVTYNFLGGKVKFTNNKLGNVEAALNSTDVLIADGTVTVSEAIEGTGTITITQSSFASGAETVWPAQAIEEIRLVVAGDEVVGTFVPASRSGTSITVNFRNLDIADSGKVKVYVDLDDNAVFEGKSMTFSSIDWDLKYSDGDTPAGGVDTAGSVSVSKLTFQKSEGSLTNTIASDEVEFTKGTSETKEIFKGTYTAKKSAVNLNKFTLTGAWVSAKGKVHVYLYLDGQPVADSKLDCTSSSCIATDTFSDVLVKADGSVEVVVEAEVNAADTTATPVKFSLVLEGEDENDNPAGIASKQSAKVSIVEKGTPEVEKGTEDKTVLLRGSNALIAEMNVKPSGASSSIDLETVEFDKGSNDCANIRLIVGGTDKTFAENGGKCVVEGITEEITKEGKTLRIELDEEPAESASLITAVVENLYLNDTKVSGTFSKAYADAVLKFTQTKRDDITEFTIAGIEKYSTATTVTDLKFFNAAGKQLNVNGITSGTELSKGDTFTVDNLASSVYVKKITYTVKRGTSFTQNVEVEYNDYKDYFKTNDGDLRTYAYGDSVLSGNTVD